MDLTQTVKNVVKDNERDFLKDPNFIKLRDFYFEMKKLGVAIRQEYTLPNLDMVGRSLVSASPLGVPSDPATVTDASKFLL